MKGRWNGVRAGFEEIRTRTGSVVGQVACIGICQGNGDSEAKGDGMEFHSH